MSSDGEIIGTKLNDAVVGDRVRVTLEGELIAYDADLGHWTLRGHSIPDRHVTWDYTLHWGTTFEPLPEQQPHRLTGCDHADHAFADAGLVGRVSGSNWWEVCVAARSSSSVGGTQ